MCNNKNKKASEPIVRMPFGYRSCCFTHLSSRIGRHIVYSSS